MTNQEAIRLIRNLPTMCEFADAYGKPIDSDAYYEAVDKAISALEKQIPKKPIRIDKNKEIDGNWKKVCPWCGRILIERITTSEKSYPRLYNYSGYCWCGQAIDWEG